MLLVENRALQVAFRRGDNAALLSVYRHYAPIIAKPLARGFSFQSQGRTCRFHGTRSTFDLEDRVQEVFARALSERARLAYDGLSSYEAYLRTIAKNLIIDDFRKKERALVEYSIDAQDQVPDSRESAASEPLLGQLSATGNPSEDVGRAELVQLVAQFEADLGGREQEIYRLRFVQELEHKDIALHTGLSASKIKTSEQRIRTRFFRFMQDRGYFTGYVQQEKGWLRWVRGLRGTSP